VARAALAWQPPATRDDDKRLVEDVRAARDGLKATTEHWTPVTALFSKAHKLLVAGRTRGEEGYEAAIARGNQLHDGFVRAEEQRVRDENLRRLEAAAAVERARQAAEAARLEAAAVAAEEASEELSARELVFVTAMVATGDAVYAATSAGYKDVAKSAARLAETPKVLAAIASAHEAAALRRQAAAVKAQPTSMGSGSVERATSQAVKADAVTWRGEVYDEAAFVEACLDGAIPRDMAAVVLGIKQAALTDYARQMGEQMNRWPGVRAVSNRSIR
jgi:hypothetical protein